MNQFENNVDHDPAELYLLLVFAFFFYTKCGVEYFSEIIYFSKRRGLFGCNFGNLGHTDMLFLERADFLLPTLITLTY